MNSQRNKPLFVYSYDPPSPDVISEYDPPYPLDIVSPAFSNYDLFDFPSIELDNSVAVDNEYNSLCTLPNDNSDLTSNNITCDPLQQTELELDLQNSVNEVSEVIDSIMDENEDKLNSFEAHTCENMDENEDKLNSFEAHTCENESQEILINEVGTNDIELRPINGQSECMRFDVQYSSFTEDSMYSSENSSSSLETTSEVGCTTLIRTIESSDKKVNDLFQDENEEIYQSSTSESLAESPNNFKSIDGHRTESKEDNYSLSLTSCDGSETIYPSDLTEEARYFSPGSTSQSLSSLLSDTITINVPCDSSSPGNESRIFDFSDNKIPNAEDGLNGISSIEENDTEIKCNGLSMSSDFEEDSVLFPSSPMISPPLTDSCTITPFPTDFPTPYSTNPTSSPLPSEFPNQQSESSSSTPSTVTSSTMFCVSRKLENLTTNAFTNDLASNNENCHRDANQNNEGETAFLNSMQNVSFSCLQNTSVSDISVNTLENMVFIGGNKWSSESLGEKDVTAISDNNADKNRKIETSQVSEMKRKFIEKSENLNKQLPQNMLKSSSASPKQLQDNKINIINSDYIAFKENNALLNKSEAKSPTSVFPPPPPVRTDSSQKHLPPPLPPPPSEENDDLEEIAPPVPSLPLYFINRETSPAPPNPPVRQYLLIPLTPGRTSPILLTPPPPPTPQRSSSYRKSPPPIPPKPRLFNPELELKNDQICSSNSLSRCNDYNSMQNNRYLPLVRELTPVPEEVTSPTRHTPPSFVSPHRNEIADLQPDQAIDKNKECENKLHSETIINKHANNININSISVGKNNQTSPSPPPPPLPPKPTGLKPLLSLKTPPPPPPTRTESLPGTPNSVKSGGRLSPCRLKDRSPPNDRKFTPSDTEREIRVSSKPPSQSSPKVPPPPAAPIASNKTSCMNVSSYGKLVINRSDLPLPTPEEELHKVFAAVKNWGWIDANTETLAIYTQFRPIIQQGPICGLVALSMASQACPSSISPEDLLIKAKEKEISRHGEMFSAKGMSELANEDLTGVNASIRRDVLPSSLSVIRILFEGDYILFPYDAEPNHFPGFKKGHKAHWGLLCGCLIQNKALTFRPEVSPFKPHSKVDNLWHLRPVAQSVNSERSTSVPPSRIPANATLRVSRSESPCQVSKKDNSSLEVLTVNKLGYRTNHFNESDFNVICLYRQGKSRNLIYAPLKDICQSNEQIIEYPTTEDYVIDSVEKGLSKQVVVLHKEIQGLSDLLGTLQEDENK